MRPAGVRRYFKREFLLCLLMMGFCSCYGQTGNGGLADEELDVIVDFVKSHETFIPSATTDPILGRQIVGYRFQLDADGNEAIFNRVFSGVGQPDFSSVRDGYTSITEVQATELLKENLKQVIQTLDVEIPSFSNYELNVKKGLIDAEFSKILSSTAKGFLVGEDTQWQRVCFDIRTDNQLEANYNRSFEDCRCICPFPSPIPGNVSSYDACANRLLFPYGQDFNDDVVPTNDDDSSGIIYLKTFFPFYDIFHESIFVNTNGVISFEGVVNDYTPDPFPLTGTWPMIAPYWADADTRNGGAIYYREMTRTDDEKLAQSIDRIIRGYDVTQANFQLIWMFVATWDQVAFYVLHQPRPMINNTFQALLVTDGRSSFTIFNYAHIHWTTGRAGEDSVAGDPDGLGGVEAQVGYNVGDGMRYYTVAGSRTEDIVDIEERSNVGVPGRYIFNVGGESVVGEDCQSGQDRDNTGSLILYPASGSMLGGNTIQIQGPCFQNTDNVMCKFLSENDAAPTTTCQFFDGRTVSCVVPILLRTGRVNVFLSIDDGATFGFRGIYTSVSIEDLTGAIPHKVRLDTDGKYPKVVWANNALDGNYYDIDIYVFKDGANSTELENGRISPAVVNDMAIESPNNDLEYELTTRLSSSKDKHVGIIRISQGDEEPGEHNSFATSIWSDPFDLSIFTDLNVPKWCSAWRNNERFNLVQLTSSDGELRCPCNLQSALIDRGRFSPSPRCSNTVHESCVDEVNIVHCVRSSTPSSEGHGLECCYDNNGALTNIEDNIHAGYAHRYHHLGREPFDEIGRVPYLSHFFHDILPYRRCCKDPDSCSANFIPARPSQDCSGYQPPRPARMNGDPHIQTLDGLAYTFNGHGEYVLMNSLDGIFMMQGRTEPLQAAANVAKATRFTAIAAQYKNGTNVHVSLNQIRGLAVHVADSDSQWSQIRFDLTPIWYDTGVTIFYSEETNVTSVSVTVAFDFGLVFIVEAANDIMSIVVVGPETMRGNTTGLLGNWNDDVTDDLQTPDGDYLPSNSSIRDIHYDFGEKWRVSPEDSVFYYATGTNYTTYSDPYFEPLFEHPNDIDQAVVEVCGDNPECIFDFQVTGDAEIAKVTKQGVDSFEEVVKSLIPVVVCGFIPTPSNGTKNGSVYTEGGVLVFDCNDGYSISNGASTIYCTQEGFWSDSAPSCEKDEGMCEFIDAPQNGAKEGSLYIEGSIIYFKCDDGFTLNGQSEIRCTDGEWSDMAPSCVKEEVMCEFIDAPQNGAKEGSLYIEGSIIYFKCDDGFTLNGHSEIRCTDGEWSDMAPSCVKEEVMCEFIDAPQNGAKNGSLYIEGSIIYFNCDDGFTLNGQSKIRCTDGEWSDIAPSCVKEDNYWHLIYIVIGILGAALLAILLLCCCYCRKRSDDDVLKSPSFVSEKRSDDDVLKSPRGPAVENDYAYPKSGDDVLKSPRGPAVENDYVYTNYTYENKSDDDEVSNRLGIQTVEIDHTYAISIFKTGQ